MKGVKYNLNFRLPTGENQLFEKLNMNQLIGISKQMVFECYNIEIKMSNHIVYNLMNRNNVNPFLKSICQIEKCI